RKSGGRREERGEDRGDGRGDGRGEERGDKQEGPGQGEAPGGRAVTGRAPGGPHRTLKPAPQEAHGCPGRMIRSRPRLRVTQTRRPCLTTASGSGVCSRIWPAGTVRLLSPTESIISDNPRARRVSVAASVSSPIR